SSALLWTALTGKALPDDHTLAMNFVVKLPAILSDLAGAALLYFLARRKTNQRNALLAASAYAYNPAIIFNSAVWGQADSLLPLLLLSAAWAISERRVTVAFALGAAALLVKLQAVVLLPVLVLAAWRLAGPLRVVRGVRIAALMFLVSFLPFF